MSLAAASRGSLLSISLFPFGMRGLFVFHLIVLLYRYLII